MYNADPFLKDTEGIHVSKKQFFLSLLFENVKNLEEINQTPLKDVD